MNITDFGLLTIFFAIILWSLGMVDPTLILRKRKGKKKRASRFRVTRICLLLFSLGVALLFAGEVHLDQLNVKQLFTDSPDEQATIPETPPPDGELIVHFIDVGQGDSTLFQGPDVTILVDAGRNDERDVIDYLQEIHISGIDLVVGTHAHADHIGQMDQVLKQFDVQEVWLSGEPHSTKTYERLLSAIEETDVSYYEPRAGETFQIGSVNIEVLNPTELKGDQHESGIAIRVTYGDISFLLTGDIEEITEHEMLERNEPVRAQIFQLGHHGSSTSNTEPFLREVQPELAVYSAGIENKYGHPHGEVMERLDRLGIQTLGTDRYGTILVRTDGITYEVSTEKTP